MFDCRIRFQKLFRYDLTKLLNVLGQLLINVNCMRAEAYEHF